MKFNFVHIVAGSSFLVDIYHLKNVFIISDKLVDVPIMKPASPIKPIKIFFTIIKNFGNPDISFK